MPVTVRNRRGARDAGTDLIIENVTVAFSGDDAIAFNSPLTSPLAAAVAPLPGTENSGAIQPSLFPEAPPHGWLRYLSTDRIENASVFVTPDVPPSFAESIRQLGVLCPIIVIASQETTANLEALAENLTISTAQFHDSQDGLFQNGRFQIVAGNRRLQAAREAGIDRIPAMVFPWGTSHRQAITLAENTQRSSNPIAEAHTIKSLMIERGVTPEAIANAMGMPLRTVINRLSLLDLNPAMQALTERGGLTVSQAQRVALFSPEAQLRLTEDYIQNNRVTAADIRREAQRLRLETLEQIPASLFADAPSEEDIVTPTLDTVDTDGNSDPFYDPTEQGPEGQLVHRGDIRESLEGFAAHGVDTAIIIPLVQYLLRTPETERTSILYFASQQNPNDFEYLHEMAAALHSGCSVAGFPPEIRGMLRALAPVVRAVLDGNSASVLGAMDLLNNEVGHALRTLQAIQGINSGNHEATNAERHLHILTEDELY